MNIIKPGQTVWTIRRFPSWAIQKNVVRDVCTFDGRQYEPSHGDDCHVRFKGHARDWYKHDKVFIAEDDAKLALAVSLRDTAKALVVWADQLESEASHA